MICFERICRGEFFNQTSAAREQVVSIKSPLTGHQQPELPGSNCLQNSFLPCVKTQLSLLHLINLYGSFALLLICSFVFLADLLRFSYYILQVLTACAKIFQHDESITERTEKWAAPTFLLVIRNKRSSKHVKERVLPGFQ
jgi:hypothetical protein